MNNEDLEVYITEPGEEYYVHIFVWRVVPFHFKLDPNIEVVDLTVKKIVSRQNEDCDANSNYDYVGKKFQNILELSCLISPLKNGN